MQPKRRCSIDYRDNIGYGWLECKDHSCIWLPDLIYPFPLICPSGLRERLLLSGENSDTVFNVRAVERCE